MLLGAWVVSLIAGVSGEASLMLGQGTVPGDGVGGVFVDVDGVELVRGGWLRSGVAGGWLLGGLR